MTWKKNIFKRRNTKNVKIWWFGEAYIQEKATEVFWYEVLEKAYFQEKRYREQYDLKKWKKKFLFKRKFTGNVMIWWLGRSLFSNEKYSKCFWSDYVEEVFQENRNWKLYDLMMLNNLFFMRNDTEKLRSNDMEEFFFKRKMLKTLWSLDLENLIFKGKDTEIFLISCLGRNFFEREKIQRRLWIADLEKIFFSREKLQRTLWSDDLEKIHFQEKGYWKLYDRMTWQQLVLKRKDTKKSFDLMTGKEPNFKRRDTKNIRIWWFGEAYIPEKRYWNLFDTMSWKKFISTEKIQRTLWSDDLEEAYFQTKRHSKQFSSHDMDETFFSRLNILKTLWSDNLE